MNQQIQFQRFRRCDCKSKSEKYELANLTERDLKTDSKSKSEKYELENSIERDFKDRPNMNDETNEHFQRGRGACSD